MPPHQQLNITSVRIGCSGWQYRHWKRDFYPAELPQSRWLEYYAERFDTVEVNNTFYRLPEAATFAALRCACMTWRDRRQGCSRSVRSCTCDSTARRNTPAATTTRRSRRGPSGSPSAIEGARRSTRISTTTRAVTRPATPSGCANALRESYRRSPVL